MKNISDKEIMELLKQARISKGITLTEASEELERRGILYSVSALSRYENNRRSKLEFELVMALADIYNFNILEAIDYSNKRIETDYLIEQTNFIFIPVFKSLEDAYNKECFAEDFILFPDINTSAFAIDKKDKLFVFDPYVKGKEGDTIANEDYSLSRYNTDEISKGKLIKVIEKNTEQRNLNAIAKFMQDRNISKEDLLKVLNLVK